MKRDDVKELHYIAPIQNIPSILQHGLLSHNRAQKLPHKSVAMSEVQARRKSIKVPGGLYLHDYVNLYFHARNPMLFKLKDQHQDLCVLQISPDVLDLPDVVITDGNASSDYTSFFPVTDLYKIDASKVFAERWTDPDETVQWEKKRVKCAEVLVPHKIEVEYIIGAYVSCQKSEAALRAIGFTKPITVDAHLFFV